jgi:hypothetical protein
LHEEDKYLETVKQRLRQNKLNKIRHYDRELNHLIEETAKTSAIKASMNELMLKKKWTEEKSEYKI